jgi:hypothetical protein
MTDANIFVMGEQIYELQEGLGEPPRSRTLFFTLTDDLPDYKA